MGSTEIILIAVACLVAVACVIALVVVSNRASRSREDLSRAYERKIEDLNERVNKLTGEKSALESRIAAQDEARRLIDEQRTKAEEARKEQAAQELQHLKDAFKALSAENSNSFRQQSAQAINELLKPINDKFGEFDRTVKAQQEKSVEQNASMKTLIEQVMERSKTVGEEARSLANALTGYSKVQGDFGEMLLTDILKNAGLQEGIHFVTQGVIRDVNGHEIKSSTGGTMIPDVMVLYPDDTLVIVDSKVSLTAYNSFMNAESVDEARRYAKEHVESVRRHVDELKNKDYASYVPDDKRKVEYNIMFIPMEGAFRLMLEEDPLLWQAARNNNVLIVSQMTLTIVLNMIQMSWKQHQQEENIADVYKTASELMSQLKAWMDSFVRTGEQLDKAVASYKESRSKLLDSNQSVVRKIDKLEKLGLSPRKSSGRLKTGGRMVGGHESIIPAALDPLPLDGEQQ